ncbi:MAG: hypothetical protein PHG54_04755 [Smithellaceae bacterium]|jgi:hypothetical protein|nr:hypothetical protein [Syntrophaceae bacterium]MDD4240720.1 hypothetical protein [Smithellaceae bacterium]NLX52773.1 hypothetical protein [Deltaproteobacteria bacterium]
MKKAFIASLLILALVAGATPALAYEASDADVIGDVLLARPAGIVGIVAGSVVFVVSLPFSLPTGSVPKVAQRLILDPVEFTFVRPVGDFDYRLGTWETGWTGQK